MQTAPLPENEAQRLSALHSYGVLDTHGYAAVDALVQVASQVCQTPIALVTLLDADRAWIMSRLGLNATEMPRELAFCCYSVLQPDEVAHVPDTLLDERFCENPLVLGEPKLRFYAGAPLVDANGFALGSLCVLDLVPRELCPGQLSTLRELSKAIVKLLEARRTETAHQAAERQNTLLRFAEEMAQLGHFRVDPQDGRSVWSAQVLDVLGWPADQRFAFTDFIAAQHPADRPTMEQAWHAALKHGVPFDLESRVLRSESELRYVHVKARCERAEPDLGTFIVYGMLQDVTERTQLRERALHQSRLIATGTLAAGVGHEINNPLTYLTGNLELAVDGLQRAPLHPDRVADIVSMLREASEGAVRIRDIVRGLRTFARSEEALHPTDIRGALNTAMSMAKHELRHRATLHEAVPAMPLVQANEARLAQIFLNLLVNAAQSFNGNDPSLNHVYVKAWKSPNDRVIVEFSDNGAGIAKELQSRIFDPFFTTKRLGEGTGLGLSISHSLVTSIKGEISCESEPGVGTKFRVSLPLADRPPLPRVKGPRSTPVPNARSGRVLIIDDEPGIARSMKQVLSQHHDAVAYVDPREACEALMREPESFDVVFCDLMMPFLTGMDLYKRLVARFPAIAERFVFMTGASIEEQVARFLAGARNPPLEKPFTLDALRPIVDRLLRERDSRLSLLPVSQ